MTDKMQATRRDFLKTTGVVTAGATLLGGLNVAKFAHAAGDDRINIALVGCGGRGKGAIRDRIQVGDNIKVVAIADAFENTAKQTLAGLIKDSEKKEGDKGYIRKDILGIGDNAFSGFDAYKKAIDCLKPGDQVVIATPPGFRPLHYRYAIEKGLHVFMEKPLFVDAPGFRHVMETNKMADAKNLKVCVGLQRRYEPRYYNWAKAIEDGKIGDVLFSRVYWNGNIWCRRREAGESEMNFQMRNWYHFLWLCGDNITEQHVHNIDVGNWIHGKGDKMAHPVEANAQGGRSFTAAPENIMRQAPPFSDRKAWDEWYQKNKDYFIRHGQAWDHFFVEFTFADGSKMFSQSRHIANTWGQVSETIHGTKGTGMVVNNQLSVLKDYAGKDIWANEEKAVKGPYQWEHDCQVKAIRENKPMNDGYFAANSCMTSVFGREAAFCGKVLKWDDVVAKGKAYAPLTDFTGFDQDPPVLPDANGFYESKVAKQGQYDPFA